MKDGDVFNSTNLDSYYETSDEQSSYEEKDYTLIFLRKTEDSNEPGASSEKKKLILLGMKLRGKLIN